MKAGPEINMTRATGGNRWTPAQLDAVNHRGGNLLVTAAAGTGKTAVLVERVKRWVMYPPQVDIDRLLVVTFTEAAAAEVRQRLAQSFATALAGEPENSHLRRQLILLQQAPICTLHSFCLRLIRRYFYLLGLDPGFRVATAEESLLLELEVIAGLFEESYEGPDAGVFAALVESYGGGRGDEGLQDLVLRLYRFSRSHPDPQGWLETVAASFPGAAANTWGRSPWKAVMEQSLSQKLVRARSLLAEAAEIAAGQAPLGKYMEVLAAEHDALSALIRRLGEQPWDEWQEDLCAFAFSRLPSLSLKKEAPEVSRAADRVKEARQQARKILDRLREEYGGRSAGDLLAELVQVSSLMQGLVQLTSRFSRACRSARERRGVLDFADLEHLALRLLAPAGPGTTAAGPLAVELQQEFVEVLVDEYQDINEVQEAILTSLAPDRLFLVGDAKQSIYRFRLAEPRLFLEKYERYQRGEGGRCLHLSVNFRSRRPVLAAVNFLCRQLLDPQIMELGYPVEAELVFGADYAPVESMATAEGPVEVYFLDRAIEQEVGDRSEDGEVEEGEEDGPLEREAALVAARLRAMVTGTPERPGPEFYVNEGGTYVPVSYRHIAVLLRATHGRANTFVAVLNRLGVPASADPSGGYFQTAEVQFMLSLLRTIENPHQDIPLAAVLRSPVVGFSDEELAEIRLGHGSGDFYDALVAAGRNPALPDLSERVSRFLARLDTWRTQARRRPLPEVIWRLLQDSGYYSFAGSLPGGQQRQANLRALVERARLCASFGRQELSSFLGILAGLEANGADPGPANALAGPGEETVRVMSVHKSKGLEFPVVVVADLGKQFNLAELKGDLLMHRDLGLGPMLVETELRYKYPTLAHRAIKNSCLQSMLAEEMRILYVALTRARERLILVGSVRGLRQKAAAWNRVVNRRGWLLAPHWLAGANSYMDWLGPALVRHPAGLPLRRLGGGDEQEPSGEVAGDPSVWRVYCGLPPALAEVLKAALAPSEGASAGDGAGEEVAVTAVPEAAIAYAYGAAPRLAAKVSVSELRRAAWHCDGELPGRPLWRSKLERTPTFLDSSEQTTGTAAGVATHLVMQRLDLTGAMDGEDINRQIAGMVARGEVSPDQAAAVDVGSLVSFWQSPLGRRLRAGADRVRREVSFSVGLPATMVYPDHAGEEINRELVLVQGTIDLLWEAEGGFLLLDFKTDRSGSADTRAMLAYMRQLYFYAQAVARIFKRPVREAYLCFLSTGETLALDVTSLADRRGKCGSPGENS